MIQEACKKWGYLLLFTVQPLLYFLLKGNKGARRENISCGQYMVSIFVYKFVSENFLQVEIMMKNQSVLLTFCAKKMTFLTSKKHCLNVCFFDRIIILLSQRNLFELKPY